MAKVESTTGVRDHAAGKQTWIHLLILVLVAVAVFANGLTGEFTFDDLHLIDANTRLDTAKGAIEGFTSGYYTSAKEVPPENSEHSAITGRSWSF